MPGVRARLPRSGWDGGIALAVQLGERAPRRVLLRLGISGSQAVTPSSYPYFSEGETEARGA